MKIDLKKIHLSEIQVLAISAAAFILAMILRQFMSPVVEAIVFGILYLFVGFDVLKEAWEGIREGEVFGEEFLMAIASIGAFAIGQYAEAVAVMLLYRIGEWLQDLAVEKSRKSITDLMNLKVEYATLKTVDGEKQMAPEEIQIGDTIIVKPGEKIPLDGVILSGTSMLNTASLTGESVPQSVKKGNKVLSGCINGDGLLEIKVEKPYAESTAAKILKLIEEAEERKARSEDFITRFARIYTPVVCILAVVLAVLPPLAFGQ